MPLVQSSTTVKATVSEVTASCAKLASANTFTATQTINGARLLMNSNTDYEPQTQLTHAGATAASAGYVILNRARGTYGSPTIVSVDDQIGNILFQGHDGTTYRPLSAISSSVDATPGANDMPGRLSFLTTPDGSSSLSEGMRLNNSGYLLIGYTASNGAYRLQVNSQIFATSATIATSDGNYKEDITPLDGALDLVAALNPVQFSWKEHPVHNFDRAQPTVGFIAQEVQQALADTPYLNSIVKANMCTIEPEQLDDEGNVTKPAVTEEFLGIAEGNMIALLTKAIQELKAEFDAYKSSHP
jgi:hypothetical protein